MTTTRTPVFRSPSCGDSPLGMAIARARVLGMPVHLWLGQQGATRIVYLTRGCDSSEPELGLSEPPTWLGSVSGASWWSHASLLPGWRDLVATAKFVGEAVP